MMHILDMVKSRISNKLKKASANEPQANRHSDSAVAMKAPLTRQLTQDEITETELALKRLHAEKQRLEQLLNCTPDRKHYPSSLRSSGTSSYSNSCEDVSTNNNVRKELVRIPRYQQKVAFLLHNAITAEVSTRNCMLCLSCKRNSNSPFINLMETLIAKKS